MLNIVMMKEMKICHSDRVGFTAFIYCCFFVVKTAHFLQSLVFCHRFRFDIRCFTENLETPKYFLQCSFNTQKKADKYVFHNVHYVPRKYCKNVKEHVCQKILGVYLQNHEDVEYCPCIPCVLC